LVSLSRYQITGVAVAKLVRERERLFQVPDAEMKRGRCTTEASPARPSPNEVGPQITGRTGD
jgi:hypothetical protein